MISKCAPHSTFEKKIKLSRRRLLSVMVMLASLGLTSEVYSQQATRSDYQAGPVQFGRFLIPTDLPKSVFVYYEDVNKDTFTDLVITGFTPIDQPQQGPRPGTILLNNGDNTFKAATGDRPQSEWVREVLVADFNGDGISDLFMADHGWDTMPFPGFQNQLMLGTGTGFQDATHLLPALNDFSHNAAVGDVNGDGLTDILVVNNPLGDANKVSYFLINRGAAGFELNRSVMPASLTSVNTLSSWAVELADLDKDGHIDMLVGRVENQGMLPSRVYWNPGDGDFSRAQVTYLPDMSRFVPGGLYAVIEAQAFDMNADGLRDIQFTAYNSSFRGLGTQFLYNTGNRQFVDRTDVCIGGLTQDPDSARDTPYFLRLLDINGDGFRDLVMVDNRDDLAQSTVFLENTGGGKWRAITRNALTNNSEILNRLQFTRAPLRGDDVFGMAEVFVFDLNGVNTLGMNYLPVTHTMQSPVPNRFDECSNRMRSMVSASEFGALDISFQLIELDPVIRIQVLGESITSLPRLPEKFANFDSATGLLTVPELTIGDTVAYRQVVFKLIDGDRLVFELVGAQ